MGSKSVLHVLEQRTELLKTPLDAHGGLDFAELAQWGLAADDVIDFSVNSNPFGPAPSVKTTMAEAVQDQGQLARYPDRECLALRHALSEQLDVPTAQFMIGNGTAELLWLIAFAFLQPNNHVLVIGPTFGEYARMARLMGAHLTTWRADIADGFAIDGEEINSQIERCQPHVVFLCNPNNPTGSIIAPQMIQHWAERHLSTLFVVDEAYIAFIPGLESVNSLALPNILVLRSMTKDYALAGLRLGYALGPVDLIEQLTRIAIPWSVNNLAQIAGIAALAAQPEYTQMLKRLHKVASTLYNEICTLGYRVTPSKLHYFLLDAGNGSVLRKKLLSRGLLVRDCASFGLPQFVRIATQRPSQNAQLLEALRILVNE